MDRYTRTATFDAVARSSLRRWAWIAGTGVVLLAGVPLVGALLGATFSYTLRTVSAGGALLGLVSGTLGSFVVLRRESLLGDALSHAALPGVAIGFLLAGRQLGVLLLGAGIASLLGVWFIRVVVSHTKLKPDGVMGIVLAGWFAAGIALLVFIQSRPDASQAGLDSFIFGQAASIVRADVRLLAGIGALVLLIMMVLWKEFKLITFDPEFAVANGYPVRAISTALSVLIVVAIVLGLQLAGVILMAGMLVAPGVAARQWTDDLAQMVGLAGVFGAASGSIGALLSALDADIPTGPMIIVVACCFVAVSLAFAPGRGLVWSFRRRTIDGRRFRRTAVLRDLYHYAYDHAGPDQGVPEEFVCGLRGKRPTLRTLTQLQIAGLVARVAGPGWRLTERGWRAAAADARRQRLWDAYSESFDRLGLPVVEIDRSVDLRDLLAADEIQRLEQAVATVQEVPRVRG